MDKKETFLISVFCHLRLSVGTGRSTPRGTSPRHGSGVIKAPLKTDLRSADSSRPEATERLLYLGLSCSAQLAPSWDYWQLRNEGQRECFTKYTVATLQASKGIWEAHSLTVQLFLDGQLWFLLFYLGGQMSIRQPRAGHVLHVWKSSWLFQTEKVFASQSLSGAILGFTTTNKLTEEISSSTPGNQTRK